MTHSNLWHMKSQKDMHNNTIDSYNGVMVLKIATTQQRGFALIELMVVIVILGILAGVVVPRIMDNPDKARVAKAKHDITALESALDI